MADADGPAVRCEVAAGVARITLNRPGYRNALSAEVIGGLLAAFGRVRADDEVRAVVLTGAGEKVFCAGGDLGDLAKLGEAGRGAGARARAGDAGGAVDADGGADADGADADGADAGGVGRAGGADVGGADAGGVDAGGVGRAGGAGGVGRAGGVESAGGAGPAAESTPPFLLFSAFRDLGKPIIARVAGHALGGGLGLAVSCDLAIAADDVKLGTPEINVGLWPMMIMAVLNRNIGPKQAFKLYYTGQPVSAAEAVSIGLLTEAVPRADLDKRVDELAGLIAGKSPAALRLGRAAFFDIEGKPPRDQLSQLHDQLAVLAATDDAREGIAAFMEKRAPRFTGS